MAVEVCFNEGKSRIIAAAGGTPVNSTFTLSRAPIAANLGAPVTGDLSAITTFANRNEASWTGFARLTQTTPSPVNGILTYTTQLQWSTGTSTDGPQDIKTLLLIDQSLSLLLYAWDLRSMLNSGSNLDMSLAGSSITVTQPFVLFLQNVGGF